MVYVTGNPVYAVADGQPIVYASLDGQEVWRASAAPAPSLSDFYGVGPGQIPSDWRLDDPVVTGSSLISGLRNDGGAGALFAGQSPVGQEPTFDAAFGGGRWPGGVLKQILFSNPVNLLDVHVIIPIDVSESHPISRDSSVFLAGGPCTIGLRRPEAGTLTTWLSRNGASGPDVTVPFASGSRLYEFRIAGGTATMFRNAEQMFSVAYNPPDFFLDRLGYSTTNDPRAAKSWRGGIGRCISVVVDPARSLTDLEPAVLLARQTLAAQYGIALA